MNKLSWSLLFLLCSITVSAQFISPFFTTMPNYIFPYLSSNNLKDLVDLQKAGKTAKVENLLKGTTELKEFTDSYIALKMNSNSTAEMKLLPLNDTIPIIAITKTIAGPASDSHVYFFSSTWNRISLDSVFPKPSAKWFFEGALTDSALYKSIDIEFITYKLNAKSNDIVISHDFKNHMSNEDYQKISPFLKPSVTLKWGNGKFIKE